MAERIYIDPPHLNIAEITETGAYYFEDDPDVWYVECEPADRWDMCIYCHDRDNLVANGNSEPRRIHDISMGNISIDIMLRTQRYKCKACGRTFRRPYDFVEPGKWVTKRLRDNIRKKMLNQPFKQVAEEFGLTIPTISEIFKGYGKGLDSKRKLVAPRVLGMDENHIGHIMRGVFTDIERGTLIEMTEDRKLDTMQAAIESMEGYDKIEIVCMDMTKGYKGLVELCCPKAKVIVDKFHVVRHIYGATESARKQIFEKLKAEVAALPEGPEKDEKQSLLRRLGKDTYLFKFGTKRIKMDASRNSLMARLCSTFPELNELRIVKMRAEKIYNDSANQFEAVNNINSLVKNIPAGKEYDEFRKFTKMVKNWMPEILNYFKYGKQYTNAATEGVNSLIKQLNNVGRGYSFEILRTKALYWSGAHRSPVTKSRQKPSSIQMSYIDPKNIAMEWTDPGNLFEQYETITISGDMSDISILLEHFDEIF